MSDLRFMKELGAEFERVAKLSGAGGQGRGTRTPQRLAPALGYALAALAVIAVIAVGVVIKGHGSQPPSAGGGQVSVAFRVAGVPYAAALERSVTVLRERLDATFKDVQVRQSGPQIIVAVRPTAKAGSAGTRSRVIELAAPGSLAFYDWEADALTPSGKTVASQLGSQDSTALTMSQGSGSAAPGSAGGMPLDRARKLSSEHRETVVLGAGSRFFVLERRPALTNADIIHPVSTTDQAGEPAVTFGFTKTGAAAFQRMTASVAHRGALVSGLGQTLNQHFAVAVDGQLLTVPSIDFKSYPDGIPGNNGADVVGAFTAQSARDLATVLRYGPLALHLVPVTRP
jgi:preprotein translocase subunit SecD